MNKIFHNLLEQVQLATENESIIVAFKDAFTDSKETIENTLKNVQTLSIERSLDIQEVTAIIQAIKAGFSQEELSRELFIIYLDMIPIDSRFIDIDKLQYAIANIGFNPKSKNYYSFLEKRYYSTEKDIQRFVSHAFNKAHITSEITKYHDDKVDDYLKMIISFVINKIRDNNQYSSVKYISNPFLDKAGVTFENQVMKITFKDLFPIIPQYHIDEAIVDDYKKHFSGLDDFLDFLLASRFGADRKKAYLWFRAESDWGKSWLFQGVLGSLKLATTITENELKQCYSGGASGFNADMFIHSWFLLVDEFKSAVSEIKNITHELTFSPKFQGQVTVPLYAKIFSSAENVRSLNNDGMVESQFANRFMFWTETGKLTERALFTNNQLFYTSVMKTYVYEYLKKRADEYIALGESNAGNEANKVLNKIIKAKKVNTDSVEEVLLDRIKEFKEDFQNNMLLEKYWFEFKGDIYIQNKDKFINVFLDEYFAEEAKKTLKYKEPNIILGIEDGARYSRRVNGKAKCGYLWFTLPTLNIPKHSPSNNIIDELFGDEDMKDVSA